MTKTQFKVGDNFGDIMSKDYVSPKQSTKNINFSAKIM